MSRFRKFLVWLLCVVPWVIIPALAVPISVISAFPTKNDGDVVFATDWNTIGNITTWINSTLLSTTNGLNCLQTAGDMYCYTGSTGLQPISTGTSGYALCSNGPGTVPTYQSIGTLTTLTTSGDTLYYNAGNQRLAIGTTGQVLSVVGGLPAWATQPSVPIGGIIAWSPAAAGTNTIPTNFALCDGGTYNGHSTPNLIGRMIMGAQPTGSGSSASTGGYGSVPADSNQGATTHTHNLTSFGQSTAGSGVLGTYSCNQGQQLCSNVALVYIERVMTIFPWSFN